LLSLGIVVLSHSGFYISRSLAMGYQISEMDTTTVSSDYCEGNHKDAAHHSRGAMGSDIMVTHAYPTTHYTLESIGSGHPLKLGISRVSELKAPCSYHLAAMDRGGDTIANGGGGSCTTHPFTISVFLLYPPPNVQ